MLHVFVTKFSMKQTNKNLYFHCRKVSRSNCTYNLALNHFLIYLLKRHRNRSPIPWKDWNPHKRQGRSRLKCGARNLTKVTGRWQGLHHWRCHLPLPRVPRSRKLESRAGLELEPRCPKMECAHPNYCCICSIKYSPKPLLDLNLLRLPCWQWLDEMHSSFRVAVSWDPSENTQAALPVEVLHPSHIPGPCGSCHLCMWHPWWTSCLGSQVPAFILVRELCRWWGCREEGLNVIQKGIRCQDLVVSKAPHCLCSCSEDL